MSNRVLYLLITTEKNIILYFFVGKLYWFKGQGGKEAIKLLFIIINNTHLKIDFNFFKCSKIFYKMKDNILHNLTNTDAYRYNIKYIQI